ncbi:HYR domain-containing protein [Myxococcus llanfairpwllgwyngyllgogerychwyrndrobwllllantysiliogogogochensis]|uniref:HYR domain-containing protein n=1 Tax=Myxococcus llanfairpwllgwyngyllgogerychwyrndrobwllllantysiliogogogochensis TaxID=2590453 RepID=A0A540WLU5_9BACT|nr:HYR domain-containing protein [Myxococcus llanfairpwllgwyngyllgogerychwyrndrobwllllantysiliogogogochensis]TQF09384.1 HYR domain-containing protein [Myxococcus llanfairpwllgwyngyllgogerychwyrndrobwllllantysiliogogogochensis]
MIVSSLLTLCLLAAPPRLIADLNPEPRTNATNARVLAMSGDTVFFALSTQAGNELWAANTAEGRSWLVKDIHPGLSSSTPDFVAMLGGKLLFRADDGVHGEELWTTDGTPAGTQLLLDIRPGGASPELRGAYVWGTSLYFMANDGVHGIEPWMTDGTPEGTRLIADTTPGAQGLSDRAIGLVEFDGALYLGSYNELWRTDGTAAGTWRVYAVDQSSQPRVVRPFVTVGKLWFSSGYSANPVSDRYVTDGTTAGTRFVTTSSGGPNLVVGGRTLFSTSSGSNGTFTLSLKASNGTSGGTQVIASILSSSTSTWIHAVNPSGTLGSFVVPVGTGSALWRTDGTSAGTRSAQSLVRMGGVVGWLGGEFVYVAADSTGPALFAWNGTAAPRVVRRFAELPTNILSAQVGGLFYFTASDGLTGQELWVSDGTEQGTVMVADLSPGADGTVLAALHPGAGQLLFTGTPQGGAVSLWRTDGSVAGTSRVSTGSPDAVVSSSTAMVAFTEEEGEALFRVFPEGAPERPVTRVWTVPNRSSAPGSWTLNGDGTSVYFSASPTDQHIELLRTDGTSPGTHVLLSVFSVSTPEFYKLEQMGDTLVFHDRYTLYANRGVRNQTVYLTNATSIARLGSKVIVGRSKSPSGHELAVSDGTVNGTSALQTLSSSPSDFVTSGARVYFRQYSSTASAYHLYRTDGTLNAGGVARMATFTASRPVAYGNKVAFIADTTSLAASDGTAAGTTLVSGTENTSPNDLHGVGPWLFFTARDATNGREVWVLDEAGARRLGDFEPGAADTRLLAATRQSGGAVLLIQTGAGRELVRTNGTPEGTTRLGAVHGTTWLTTLEDTVFLDCDPDGLVGLELCSLPAGATAPLLVADFSPGLMPSSPSAPVYVAGSLLVAASHPDVGREPFAVDVDVTPPVIKPTVTGTLGKNGFYVSDVTLTWSVTDTDTPVSNTSGCDSVVLTVDTLGQVFTCSATSEGGTAVERVTLPRDTSPPVVTCPGQVQGTEATPVEFSVTATDAVDPAPVVVTTPPSGAVFPTGFTVVEASATDRAGHRSFCQFSVLVSEQPAPDAGPNDAGPVDGGGLVDGGPGDGGSGGSADAGRDAGGTVDAGVTPTPPAVESSSCGCGGGGGQLLFGLTLLLLPALSRRRR